jgi:membrane-associated phospholipid phosphatase
VKGGRKSLVTPDAPVGASPQAAAAQAAHDTLVALFPTREADFDDLLTTSLDAIPDGTAEDDGVEWGATVAAAILEARTDDGSVEAATTPYTPGTDPGDWQPTPPANAAALLPGWGDVTPFGINRVNSFVPNGPPKLTGARWAAEFNEVKELGSATSTTRTADQTEIAQFWADGGGTFTPPGHWNAIAADLVDEDGVGLFKTAKLFAQLDVALADAAIVCWETKFKYNFWRPVTAIRAADTDGNPATEADTTWTPLLVTPPFPDYTSGHSTFSGAASSVLAAAFGATREFSATSDNGATTRTFTSFRAAADEAGMSRIYGGIHYMSANLEGLRCGRQIAASVLQKVG